MTRLTDPARIQCIGDAIALPRRRFLVSAAAVGAFGASGSTLAFAGNPNAGGKRFVLVILRGGMDGLAAVPAIGDADFAAARGPQSQVAQSDCRVPGVCRSGNGRCCRV